MAHLLELFRRFCPGALAGAVGSDPVRVVRLDLAQFNHQFVELEIADERRVQYVVAVVVEVDLLLEFFVTLLEIVSAILSPMAGQGQWQRLVKFLFIILPCIGSLEPYRLLQITSDLYFPIHLPIELVLNEPWSLLGKLPVCQPFVPRKKEKSDFCSMN